MSNEELSREEAIFTIITGAGEARAKTFEAVSLAEEGKLEEAKARYKEVDSELHSAHKIQTSFIQQESSGTPVEINMLFIHAQDHLMTAISEKAMAGKLLALHEKVNLLESRLIKIEETISSSKLG
ncbi:PTS lactose/cellobiose transporter subunit IIA [Entomospira entomophila]|uniref:PTS lactose/cellobiose transporter subunit IIA n=1 Tax=Entomospira entomophila TaxID=2719988 RepID=A0A968G848_9SPIO|nr:PTS lactose/cellobiose transporter subunit IIA [Entomospira entomophilus]NIZ40332.1 PTS lactose/cellobiose transporter subunit IIA [Entomospira entomophilus]WDI35891.1 PTS lactose/cellobiose transporter subunit IIA [Entomospira entomophilus]